MATRYNRAVRFTAIVLTSLICVLPLRSRAEDTAPTTMRDRLEQAVRQQASEGFLKYNLTAEIVAVHLPVNIDGLNPDAEIRPLRTFLPDKAAGRYVIPMEILSGDGKSVKVNTTIESAAVINGWVSLFPVERGTLLEPEDFERKEIRVTWGELDYFTADSLPSGYQLSSTLAQGQLLQFHHLEAVPAVQRGEQVMIHYQSQHVTLISPGKTRSEGCIGDLIPVVANNTGKRLYGRLIAPGIVLVE